jgi:nucleoside-diphosphate-sugar epimerase
MKADTRRVFVTGATGFVGGALVRALVRDGAQVHVLARRSSNHTSLDDVAVTWHEGDVTVPSSLRDILADATWIIHASGRLGETGLPERVYREVNVEGTRNILTAALDMRKRPRVLHVSSPGVLGPIAGEPATEEARLAPSNPYERSKAAAEDVARDFAARGLEVVIARPEFIYGPGDRHVLGLYTAIRRGRFFYINGGQHNCHPTYIADAVNGMLLCLSRGRPGEVYHITGPRPVSFRELGDTIAKALNVRAPSLSLPRRLASAGAAGLEVLGRLFGVTPPLSRSGVAFFSEDRRFSWQKAHRELGYSPQFDLAAGVSETVQWYRERGWL